MSNSEDEPTRHRVTKANGGRWIVTYAGKSGVRWDRDTGPYDEDEDVDDFVFEPTDYSNLPTPEPNPWQQFAAEVLTELIIEGLERGAPHAKRWLNNTAVPFLREGWKRPSRRKKLKSQASEEVAAADIETAEKPAGDDDGFAVSMTREQAKHLLDDLEICAERIARDVKLLSNAHISDEGDVAERSFESRNEAQEVIVHGVTAHIEAMLEGQTFAISALDIMGPEDDDGSPPGPRRERHLQAALDRNADPKGGDSVSAEENRRSHSAAFIRSKRPTPR